MDFKKVIEEFGYKLEGETVLLEKEKLLEFVTRLKECGFDYFSFVTAVDYLSHFELIYRIRSIEGKSELTLKIRIGREEKVPSLVPMYEGADWMEREVYDLFGITFLDHPDLRRILLFEDWEGYPLRKDYPMDAPHKHFR